MRGFTHFYSDPHFGHANVIRHANRPFACLEDMDATLANNYECVVGPDDYVLWTGDCTWRLAALPALLASLPGRKALVLGNHDGKPRRMASCGFEFVADRVWLDLGGVPAIACHYPPWRKQRTPGKHDSRYIDRFPRLGKGQVSIHGHTHEKGRTFGTEPRVHVGVDAWDFAPAPIEEVTRLARGLVTVEPPT